MQVSCLKPVRETRWSSLRNPYAFHGYESSVDDAIVQDGLLVRTASLVI